MSRYRKHINIHILNIYRNMTYCLNSVCMKQHSLFLANLTDFSDWLNRADFIISSHNCNKAGFICNCIFNIFRFYYTV